MMPSQKQVEAWRKEYPSGTRIKLIHMNDPFLPVPPGTLGTVDYVDDAGNVHMKWDNGRTLAICPEIDEVKKI